MRCNTITFTSFKDADYTVTALKNDGADWWLYGREVCPTTGKVHLQGMAHAKKKQVWKVMKGHFHIEKCINPIKSIVYC